MISKMKCISLSLLMVLTCVFSASALTVIEGLAPYQTVQCNEEGMAQFICSGTWSGSNEATIHVRVLRDETPVVNWHEAGKAASGRWSCQVDGVPVGGPYTVEFRADESIATVEQVLVGDVWVLAGQSNMQGVGNMIDVVPPHAQVSMFAMNGAWRPAREPLHILAESVDLVHFRPDNEEARAAHIEAQKNAHKGAGLGMAFAVEMVRRTGRPVGLVCAAHGGTSMDQWSPDKRDEGGESLYGAMLLQVERSGGAVRGVLWYQGESDANSNTAPVFRDKFEAFVAAVRRDLDNPELPFYYVQIGRFVHPDREPAPWNKVQQMQLDAEDTDAHVALAAAVDLELDDLIHVGVDGLKQLGRRLVNLAERDLFEGNWLAGPRPHMAEYHETPYGKQIRITFSGVNGRLLAFGRPVGFTLSSGADGPDVPRIYKVELPEDAPNRAILWIHELPEDAHVWYGRGLNPCANITDEADMALPAFGALQVIL